MTQTAASNETTTRERNGEAGQVPVGTNPTPIRSRNTGRHALWVSNLGTAPVFLGGEDVNPQSGFALFPGREIPLELTGPLWGIVPAGTVTVSFLEIV